MHDCITAWMHERNHKLQTPNFKTCPSFFDGKITKSNDQNSKPRAVSCLEFEIWILELACYLVLVICHFIDPLVMYRRPRLSVILQINLSRNRFLHFSPQSRIFQSMSLKGYIQLTRPVNLLIAFLSIFVGGFVTGTIQPLSRLLLAALSGSLIAAGANAINDVFDLAIDKINKPQRPLPMGRVRVASARGFACFLFIIGCGLAVMIHPLCLGISLITSLWLYLYSWRLKGTILWGNFSVAFISGLAFVYGGLAVGRWKQALVVGIFAFFFHFAREMIKDMEDMEGDLENNAITFPVRYGIRPAQIVTSILIFILIGLTWIPYQLGIFNRIYLVVVLLGVDLELIGVVVLLWADPRPENWRRLSVLMKADMLMGLVAVYLGS
jgi:geranylgeranylglycerol-phosphate geranylgeranyltransferase